MLPIDLRTAYVTRISIHIYIYIYTVIFSRMFPTLHCNSMFNIGVKVAKSNFSIFINFLYTGCIKKK